MKERYNVEIADVHLTILSDEPEDFVTATVDKINSRISDMILTNRRCSKLDAALLCALDYCGEYQKAERRIRNLEAQISLYDANLKRLREELAQRGDAPESARAALGVPAPSDAAKDAAAPKDEAPKAVRPTREARPAEDTDTVNMLETEAPKAEAASAEDANRASARSKLEEIEKLLRKSND